MGRVLRCHAVSEIDFVSGSGCRLVDAAGRSYLDLEAGVWSVPLGHAHPAVVRTIAEQAGRLAHAGTAYPGSLARRAAELVLDVAGVGDGAVTLLCSGSEAIALGVKAIRYLTGRQLIVTLGAAFYGSLVGPTDPGWLVIDPAATAADLDAVDWATVAGLAMEPGGSAIALLHFPDPGLVDAIAARVRAAGGLVLVNEVTTGIGRTGRWLGIDHYDLQPDLVALGKGLGNGYPVSALAVSAEVAAGLEDGTFRYVQSHQNDPLGAAVAATVLTTIRDEGWIEQGRAASELLRAGLVRAIGAAPGIRDIRGRGPMLGVELDPADGPTAVELQQRLLARGVVTVAIAAGQLVRMDPAIVLRPEDVEVAVATFVDALDGTLG